MRLMNASFEEHQARFFVISREEQHGAERHPRQKQGCVLKSLYCTVVSAEVTSTAEKQTGRSYGTHDTEQRTAVSCPGLGMGLVTPPCAPMLVLTTFIPKLSLFLPGLILGYGV